MGIKGHRRRNRSQTTDDPALDGAGQDLAYRSLFDGIPVGLYITTPDGTIVDANSALVGMLGYEAKDDLLGMNASQIYADPEDRRKERGLLAKADHVRDFETRLRMRDGRTIWVRDTCRAVRDAEGRIRKYEGVLQDITEQKEYERKLSHMARHDPLTGVFNRHALAELLAAEVRRARRYSQRIGVLMVDVDRFKEVNDRFGHEVGDLVLCRVAGVLLRSVRDCDVVVRYGGDEFLVLLIHGDAELARVRQRIERELAADREARAVAGFQVTLSIGTARWDPQAGEAIERALDHADRAMYEEKRRASCP